MAGNDTLRGDAALVVAVAAGFSVKQAAEQAGMSERTAHRRLSDPAIKAQIEETRRGTLEQVSARLTAAGLRATTTLLQLLDGRSEATRLQTAKAILELGVRYRELQDVETRLAILEERLAAQPQEANHRWGR